MVGYKIYHICVCVCVCARARCIIKIVPYSILCLYCSMVLILRKKIMYIIHYVYYAHMSCVSVVYLLLEKGILIAVVKFIFHFSVDCTK